MSTLNLSTPIRAYSLDFFYMQGYLGVIALVNYSARHLLRRSNYTLLRMLSKRDGCEGQNGSLSLHEHFVLQVKTWGRFDFDVEL